VDARANEMDNDGGYFTYACSTVQRTIFIPMMIRFQQPRVEEFIPHRRPRILNLHMNP